MTSGFNAMAFRSHQSVLVNALFSHTSGLVRSVTTHKSVQGIIYTIQYFISAPVFVSYISCIMEKIMGEMCHFILKCNITDMTFCILTLLLVQLGSSFPPRHYHNVFCSMLRFSLSQLCCFRKTGWRVFNLYATSWKKPRKCPTSSPSVTFTWVTPGTTPALPGLWR